MKKNVSKFLIGIFFSSLMFFGCPQQPNESSSQTDKFDAVENDEETKNAVEDALKDVKSTPKTEEEFQAMVKEIIAEFSSINGNNARFVSPNGDEISSKTDIIEKLKSIIDNIKNSGLSTSTAYEIKFSFDESINIKDATVTDLIEALSEIDELKSIVGNIPEEQKKLANEFVKINNLYAKAKADIDFDWTKWMSHESIDDSIGSANVEFLASGTVLNLEKLANETLPIKAVSAVVSMDANASAKYKDVTDAHEIIISSSSDTDFENAFSGASFGYNAEGKITLAVCTKSGIGGKLIVEGKVSIDKDVIPDYLKIMKEFEEKIKDINDYEKITEEMINDIDELLGEKFKVKVSIGDFSKEYSYKELVGLGINFSSL